MKEVHLKRIANHPYHASEENVEKIWFATRSLSANLCADLIDFTMSKHRIGIIGGTGLYNIEGLTNQKWVKVKTPFGAPSDEFLTGKLAGRDVVFLARHGRGHRILPSELNHRANIWAMKKLGVQWIVSVSAVGSLQDKYQPCDIVVIDQFLDRTKQSLNHTFFGRGIVAHVAFAKPICEELRAIILKTAQKEDANVHDGGTYVCMEGPAFSTRAESLTNHNAGYDVIGMTNLGEAKCAREAEIAYATMAMATDYDCWKEEEHVTLELIIANLHRNADTAKKIVAKVVPKIPKEPNWPCHSALKNAIMTDKKFWPKKTASELKPLLAKYQ
jgi:5'-methylthioadenosine phosphorylase